MWRKDFEERLSNLENRISIIEAKLNMSAEKSARQKSFSATDFDKELDKFIDELNEIHEEVLRKKRDRRMDLYTKILLGLYIALCVEFILLEVMTVVKIISK